MQSLKPSTGLIGDGAALRARLAEDGYLYFPGLLDPDKVSVLTRDILQTIARFGWLADNVDPMDAVPSWPARSEGVYTGKDRREDYLEGYIAIQRLESFHRQAYAPEVLELLRTLYDEDDILVHGQRIARVIWPSSPVAPPTPPHQDITHIQGTADFVTTWVPLTDCPRDRGGLRILPGSHRNGIRAVAPMEGAGGIGCKDVSNTDPNWATTDWHVGDLVLFHPMTVHASKPNSSRKLRLSVDYRYQSAKDPVAVNSLKPHLCGLDWPELLKSVSWRSYQWVDRARSQSGLQIAEMVKASGLNAQALMNYHMELAAALHPSRLLQSVE